MSRVFTTSAPIERTCTPHKQMREQVRRQMSGKVQGLSDIRRPSFINKVITVLKGSRGLA